VHASAAGWRVRSPTLSSACGSPFVHGAGTIPTSICDLPNLKGIFLDQNQLDGTIPSCIGTATMLEDVRLWKNHLTGFIPTSIGALSNLKTFIVDQNDLIGTIPAQMGSLSSVTYIALYTNELTGSLPASLGSLKDSMAGIGQLYVPCSLIARCEPLLDLPPPEGTLQRT
jgi:Leucine-rich repeat (LRR) protein